MNTTEFPATRRSTGGRRWRSLSAPAVLALAAASLTGSGAPAQAAPLPTCTAADVRLSAQVVRGSAGAGSHSEALTATNTADHSCFLHGHPGVQRAQKTSAGLPLPVGAPAEWTGERPVLIRLAPGARATAVIRQRMVAAYPPACDPVDTNALAVYLPDTTRSLPVSVKGRACTSTGYVTMEVGVFTTAR